MIILFSTCEDVKGNIYLNLNIPYQKPSQDRETYNLEAVYKYTLIIVLQHIKTHAKILKIKCETLANTLTKL